MDKLISVIVPIFNGEKCFEKCIDSILGQTYSNLEIILVDDGSTDKSPQICDEYALKDNRIKVIHKDNYGVSAARNIGLENMIGEYVSFIDCDDYIEKEMYEKMMAVCKNENCDFVACKYDLVVDDHFVDVNESKFRDVFENRKYEYLIKNKDKVHGSVCRTLFSNSIIKNIRFNTNLKISEDLLFTLTALRLSNKCGIVDDCCYHYVQSSNEINKKKYYNCSCIRDRYLLCNELNKVLGNNVVFDSFKFTNYLAIIKCANLDSNRISFKKYLSKSELKFLNNNSTFFAYLRENTGFKKKITAIFARCKMFNVIKFAQKKSNNIK